MLTEKGMLSLMQRKLEKRQSVYEAEEYSPIIGYNSPIYGTSGLRKTYEEKLLLGGKDRVGATIRLTTDNELQSFCYHLLGGKHR